MFDEKILHFGTKWGQEGVEAGNLEESFLLPACRTDDTKDFPTAETLLFSYISLLLCSIIVFSRPFLSHCKSFTSFTYIAVSIIKESFHIFCFFHSYCFHNIFTVSTSAPLLAPTITNMDMYHFDVFLDSTIASTNHSTNS